eukprot:scaffold168941_cov34-Tisochrysis_lutea.AAC.1
MKITFNLEQCCVVLYSYSRVRRRKDFNRRSHKRRSRLFGFRSLADSLTSARAAGGPSPAIEPSPLGELATHGPSAGIPHIPAPRPAASSRRGPRWLEQPLASSQERPQDFHSCGEDERTSPNPQEENATADSEEEVGDGCRISRAVKQGF